MNTETEPMLNYVIDRLRGAMPKNWPEISKESGVPEDTLRKIAYRDTKDPRISSVQALYDYFRTKEPTA